MSHRSETGTKTGSGQKLGLSPVQV